jgi:ATP-binding cassette subfamily B protein
MSADVIIVLDHGRIVEQGTHEELLRLRGRYRELWGLQAGFVVSGDGRWAAITAERLRKVPLFATAVDEMLVALARRFVSDHYEPGDVVIQQGDVADSFFIVVRGSLQVMVTGADGKEHQIDEREDGEFFGEIGLLQSVPRTATVRAVQPTLLLTLTRNDFENLMQTFPDLRDIVESAAAERMERVRRHQASLKY